jgi:hypothetical protein
MKIWHRRVLIAVVVVVALAGALLTIHVIVNNVSLTDVFKSMHGR